MLKTLGNKIKALFGKGLFDEKFFESMEDLLVESDIGASLTMEISDQLREAVKTKKLSNKDEVLTELKSILRAYVKTVELNPPQDETSIYLVLGVNGVGKTTSIAKLAQYYSKAGVEKIVFCAGDTFRAAAIDQLKIHGERTGFRVIAQQHGSDPGAVIYDSLESAHAQKEQLILADTAGRMHNKKNLVKELQKIDKIITKKIHGGQYRKILVIDATTGQNGLRQAEDFHEAVGIDALILTKYDSTAKGGLILSICRNLGIPFAFIGQGEGLSDLRVFDADKYLDELLDLS